MNSKERIHAALAGQPVDRMPATVLYSQLYHLDHFTELTGRPAWQRHPWGYAEPEEHLELFKQMVARAPFEVVQPHPAPSREARSRIVFYEKEGKVFQHDKKNNSTTPVTESESGHATDYVANETQYVFNKQDFNARFRLVKAEELLASGRLDYVQAAVRTLGQDHFICAGGLVSILWDCIPYLGQTNMLTMLIDKPGLIDYMGSKILEADIESIRAWGETGADAVYIDDAMGYADVISVAHYERFCLPYLKEMVKEIQRQGMKVILIYFGGVADRLEQIASTGAEGLSVEATMKNYVNDIQAISRQVGGRISLFGNIDPVGVLQNGTDGQLSEEINRQAAAAQYARGFIMCTGSPVTPGTPLKRVRLFLELSQRIRR